MIRSVYIALLFVLTLLFSCASEEPTRELTQAESDSLTAEIQARLEKKKRIMAYKESFEKSSQMQQLLKYKTVIKKYSKRYGFDWRLIVAQIMQESAFREHARSPVGARGLMQLMPGTAKEISNELDIEYILKNPRENIAAGIYHMKKQFAYFPNADLVNRTKLSLASYNCGPGRVFDAQDIARYMKRSPNKWPNVEKYLPMLRSSDWEMHLQVWPQGRPRHGYFYGSDETTQYVNNIWDLYEIYQQIL